MQAVMQLMGHAELTGKQCLQNKNKSDMPRFCSIWAHAPSDPYVEHAMHLPQGNEAWPQHTTRIHFTLAPPPQGNRPPPPPPHAA